MILMGLVFLMLALLHFVGDFCFQTNDQALNKSSSNRALAEHVFTYCLPFAFFLGFKFAVITALAHFITDWNTSRVTKCLWNAKDTHMFFVVIGFDQFLHLCQLVVTFLYLFTLTSHSNNPYVPL